MSIGADIKEVVQEVGTSYTILRDAGNISGEYLDYESNSQVTKPFIREHFLETNFSFDSEVVTGDTIRFDSTGQVYLVMNLTPSQFENDVIEKEGVVYKANVSGELWRPTTSFDSDTYQTVESFVLQASGVYGVQVETLFGSTLEQEERVGQIEVESDLLYIPARYNPQVLDRYVVSSGESGAEYYKIEVIEKRSFPGVYICHLSEDTRTFP